MKPIYHFEHVHIRSRDPQAVAQYFHEMFDAKIIDEKYKYRDTSRMCGHWFNLVD
jgi:hypothetical protein